MFSKLSQLKKDTTGFTIIELLIVIVIIGILAAVAVPSYTRYITIARASEAPRVIDSIIEYAHAWTIAHPGSVPYDNPTWWYDFTPDGLGGGDYFDYSYTAAGLITAAGNGADSDIPDTEALSYDLSEKAWSSTGSIMGAVKPSS